MTKEEAIKWVDDRMCWGRGTFTENHPPNIDECWEAGVMAIKALKAEPTDTDLISRADAIKAIRKCKFESDMPSYWYRGMEDAQDIIKDIPSAELPKGDLISRKVLMDRLESFCKWCKDGRLQGAEFVWDCIVPNVPSADAVHGEWVRKYDDAVNCYWYECNQCGEYRPRNQFGNEYNANYCPNCGAKMKGGDDE